MTFMYKGVVEEVLPVQKFASGFIKRDVVIGNDMDNPSKYQNLVRFSFKRDCVEKIATLKKGDRVVVRFAIDGRRWERPNGVQYFVDLTGLDISFVDGVVVEKKEAPAEVDGNEMIVLGQDCVADDIPF